MYDTLSLSVKDADRLIRADTPVSEGVARALSLYTSWGWVIRHHETAYQANVNALRTPFARACAKVRNTAPEQWSSSLTVGNAKNLQTANAKLTFLRTRFPEAERLVRDELHFQFDAQGDVRMTDGTSGATQDRSAYWLPIGTFMPDTIAYDQIANHTKSWFDRAQQQQALTLTHAPTWALAFI